MTNRHRKRQRPAYAAIWLIPEEVVAAVDALTKQKGLSYEENLEPVAANELARDVKAADMLSNLGDNPSKNQIRKYARGLLRLLGD